MAAPVSGAASSPAIKSEPCEDPVYDIVVERIKSEEEEQSLLYADHEVKEEMVIGPTEIQRPVPGWVGVQEERAALGREPSRSGPAVCRVEVVDVAEELLCGVCGAWFLTAAERQRHTTSHTTPSSLHSPSDLHQREKPEPQPPVPTKTDKPSPNDPLYTLAKRRNGTSGYKCTTCKRAFYTKEGVIQHYDYQHVNPDGFYTLTTEDGVSNYKCNMCSKDFKNIKSIRIHYKNVHLKQKSRTKCPECNKVLAPSRKAEHRERRHGIPAPTCGVCGKKFAYAYELVKHQKVIHMGETYFQCSSCEMSFPTRSRLQKHEVKHSSVRMFTCDLCGKSFKRRMCLTQHIKIHLDIRKYFCKLCPASFVHCTGIKYHMAKKHQKQETSLLS